MLGWGLLRDGTSTEKESRQRYIAWAGTREPLFCAKIAVETTWQATCTSHKKVVKLLDGLCVFESWRKERKRAC